MFNDKTLKRRVNEIRYGVRHIERFRKYRGLRKGEEDFTVQTYEDMMEVFTSVIGILNGECY